MLCACGVQCLLSSRWFQCNICAMHNSHMFPGGSSHQIQTPVCVGVFTSQCYGPKFTSTCDVSRFSAATQAGHQVRKSQYGLQIIPLQPLQNSHVIGHDGLLKMSRRVWSAALEWAQPSKGPLTDPMNLMQEAAAPLTPSLVRIIHCNAQYIGG